MGWIRTLRGLYEKRAERNRLTSLGLVGLAYEWPSEDELRERQNQHRLEEKPHPLNAPGGFYSIDQGCIACMNPQACAPDLMDFDDGPPGGPYGGCFFRKQPETPDEIDRAIRAVRSSCIDNLRYGGNDPEILKKLSWRMGPGGL